MMLLIIIILLLLLLVIIILFFFSWFGVWHLAFVAIWPLAAALDGRSFYEHPSNAVGTWGRDQSYAPIHSSNQLKEGRKDGRTCLQRLRKSLGHLQINERVQLA